MDAAKMTPPFFTIITSTYNAAATLPHLLDSLASQTCRDFNWIVQDGASSDATMQIMEQYRSRLPEILADSSKDSGIYDAWNKAIDRWQDNMGEWVLFLGADDMLTDKDTLHRVKNKIKQISNKVLFCAGDIIIVNHNNIKSKTVLTTAHDSFKRKNYRIPFPHSSLFTKKSCLLTHKFDTSFKIRGDYDFILKILKNEDQIYLLHTFVTYMSIGGISSQETMRRIYTFESLKIFFRIKSIRGLIWCFDNYIYQRKIKLKNIFQQSNLGEKIWFTLQYVRKKFFP